jgi:hypothetical protein
MTIAVISLLDKLLNEHEQSLIEEEFFKVRDHRAVETEDDGPFTEHHLDTSINELTRNDTSRSIILAPFNSTQSDMSISFSEAEIIYPKKVIKFCAKVREIDRQFERNNNCEVDNGVYNKVEYDIQAGEGETQKNQFDPFASGEQDQWPTDPHSPKEIEDKKPKRKCVARVTEAKQFRISMCVM